MSGEVQPGDPSETPVVAAGTLRQLLGYFVYLGAFGLVVHRQ